MVSDVGGLPMSVGLSDKILFTLVHSMIRGFIFYFYDTSIRDFVVVKKESGCSFRD
jgi:hypothetical protein